MQFACVRVCGSRRFACAILALALASMPRKTSFARLDAFTRGQIVGLRQEGATRASIVKRVKKLDGTRPSIRAVDAVLAKKAASPAWHGEDSSAGGRPRTLTTVQAKQLLKLAFDERGSAKVTASYCQKRLPFLRLCSKELVPLGRERAPRVVGSQGPRGIRPRSAAATPGSAMAKSTQ